MIIETKADFARALDRLSRRDAESLAVFILSLAQDAGPVGEQVRTFIVGDDVKATVESIGARIRELRTPTELENRRQLGQEIGQRLELILEAIETLVLPVNPKKAFELLVRVFKADAVAMGGDPVLDSAAKTGVAKTSRRQGPGRPWDVREPTSHTVPKLCPLITRHLNSKCMRRWAVFEHVMLKKGREHRRLARRRVAGSIPGAMLTVMSRRRCPASMKERIHF